jgi:hypothetical protein
MASFIYPSYLRAVHKADIDFDTVTVKMLLVTSSYTADKDHDFRNDVTSEMTASGTYVTGGVTVSATLTHDTTNNRFDLVLGAPTQMTGVSGTARASVYYISRGGASSADELIAYNDFGGDYTASNGTFDVAAVTIRYPA